MMSQRCNMQFTGEQNKQFLVSLRGFSKIFWVLFGNRSYARNQKDKLSFAFLVIFYSLMALAMSCYVFLPFKFISFMGIFGVLIAAFLVLFEEANEIAWASRITVIISSVVLTKHMTWGFSLFGFSMEPYFLNVVVVISLIATLRRLWNGIIWRVCDGIVSAQQYNTVTLNKRNH